MREYIDPSTGEIVAVLSMSTWESLVATATTAAPCAAGACTSLACTVMRGLLAAHDEREPFAGPLAPHAIDTCARCAAPVGRQLEHYDDSLGCWRCTGPRR